MRMGKMKLPAAVPETQMPLARALRLLKYIETMMIPGVVDNPPPIPEIDTEFEFSFNYLMSTHEKCLNESSSC